MAAAVEFIVGLLKTRAPGMTLGKMPIFAWYMLVTAGMIMIGMPAVIAADILLELERAFGMPFYDATRGGDPLLWQHLFWLFGHPEVYIIFLPAAGMVSMMLPTLRPHAPRRLHVGGHGGRLDRLSQLRPLGPSHVHDRTAARCRCRSSRRRASPLPFRWVCRSLPGSPPCGKASRCSTRRCSFILGFLSIFVLGGLTGVMVASVPYDWQVHDTYFVVAHFHYVLIGGMVFPVFAAVYYWTPWVTGRLMSPRLGRWAFALMFVGFNGTFLPMHLTGLRGMPRRVYTFDPALGINGLNMGSTIFTFVMGVGVLVVIVDFIRHFRSGTHCGYESLGCANTRMGRRQRPARLPKPAGHRVSLSRHGTTRSWRKRSTTRGVPSRCANGRT